MAKIHIIKNNISAGELSPLLSTRPDIAHYHNGAKRLFNVLPLVEGGVKKRPGTFFLQESTQALRLIPFIVSAEDAYLLIFKAQTIDVYDPRAYSIVASITHEYSASQIKELQYTHTRYSMFITHGDSPVHWLRCSKDFSNWSLDEFQYDVPPLDEVNTTPNAALKPSGIDVGALIVLEASAYASWSNTQQYFVDDRVIMGSKTYACLKDNKGQQPNDTESEYWQELFATDASVFTAENIGDYIKINGGTVKITEFVAANKVKGEVITALSADVQAIAKSWTTETSAFNSERGYPKCCTYFKQRLVLGNTKTYPNQVWFSRIGDARNFLQTTNDGDAFSVASSSDQSDNILHLTQSRGVVALTGGAEFLITSDGALAPTTVEISEHTAYGAFPYVRPCRVGNELLFVQRGGERLRALAYRYEVDGLVSPELSVMASHIGEEHDGFVELAYQQEPESTVWCVLGDGKVASITFNREQDVSAWAQHDFCGRVMSMCAMPSTNGGDQCFALVQRNESTLLEELSFNALSDCQVVVNAKQPSNQDYLIHPVSYVKDGDVVYSFKYPQSGQTYNHGEQFNCEVALFPHELTNAPATTLANRTTVHQAYLYLRQTMAIQFNNELVELYTFDHKTIAPPKPFTGRATFSCQGWTDLYDMNITISQSEPLPFHLQALSLQLSINEK